ncbi:hypothetical protein C7293_23795 [filamentous cyanobacterium CCT1]|nr:hypothetical protein C7293_23795 [filamentous cyanobacterium CCT1]PSN81157.1 hypothetical protein C8B47_02705 [filamentous cyanobacterium CCP4]
MSAPHRTIAPGSPSARFLAAWVGANLAGGFVVGFLENNGLQFMATLILTGAIVGSLQWCVLRVVLSRGGGLRWWPLASALGWIVSALLRSLMQGLYAPVVNGLWQTFGFWEVFWLNLVTGPLMIWGMAIAQGLILRRRGLSLWGWVVLSLVGGALQGAASAALCAGYCPILPPLWAGGIVAGFGWAVYGLVTGLWLVGRSFAQETV